MACVPYSDSDGFVTVSKKKSARQRRASQSVESSDITFDIESIQKKIVDFKEEIRSSSIFLAFWTCLEKAQNQIGSAVADIICLGLGKISSCRTAQYQLALLLAFTDKIQCTAEAYDPIFSKGERDLLIQLGIKISKANLEGNLVNSLKPTLYFLPHCPRELTNNLLYSNWSVLQLSQCFIIANSFEKIILNTPHRLLSSYHYLLQISSTVQELPIENCFHLADIFNDLSLHIFPKETLTSLEPSFWAAPKPVYSQESCEFIPTQ